MKMMRGRGATAVAHEWSSLCEGECVEVFDNPIDEQRVAAGMPPLAAETDPVEVAAPPPDKPQTVLEEAQALVYGNREADYGHPRRNMLVVADLWTAYLRGTGKLSAAAVKELDPGDAAAMLLLLKVARVASGRSTRDTVTDLAGYAAVFARVRGIDE